MSKLDAFDGYLSKMYSQDGGAERYRKRRMAYVRHNYCKYLPADRDAAILDIGPGFGELLAWLTQQQGYRNAYGVDLSQEVADVCNRIMPGHVTAVPDTRIFLEAQPQHYDCIFMIHVLEHVPKPDVLPLLRAVRGALRPGGVLVIEVPNMSNPIIGLRTRYDDFTHETGYTEISLRHVLMLTSFDTVDVGGISIPRESLMRYGQIGGQQIMHWLLRLANGLYGNWRKTNFAASIYGVARAT